MTEESNHWMVGRDHHVKTDENGKSTSETWVCIQLSSSRSSTTLSLSPKETRKLITALILAAGTPEPDEHGKV